MCRPAKAGEKAAWVRTFVHKEFQAAGVRVSDDVEQLVIEAVGSDLRELAAACSQLVADTGGKIDAAAVRRWLLGQGRGVGIRRSREGRGRSDTAGALEALRWAMHRGVAHVLLADALADAVHTIARVGSAGRGDPFFLASSLGMPPWKVKKAQAQARTVGAHCRSGPRPRWSLRSTPTSREPRPIRTTPPRARRAGHLRAGGLRLLRRARARARARARGRFRRAASFLSFNATKAVPGGGRPS